MKDLFYIVKINDGWYRLHIKDTHYCLGSGESVKPLISTVTRLVRKYKTKAKLFSALSRLEDKGHVNDKMTEVYEEEYELYGDACEDLIEEAVTKALERVKNNTPLMRSKRISRMHKGEKTITTGISSDSSPSETLTTPEKPAVKKLPRRIKRLVPKH